MRRVVSRHPIPDHGGLDMAAVRQWPINECGEAVVPASLCPERRILVRPQYFIEGLPGALPECFVREGVLERLLRVADTLPSEYKLVLLDAWRPFSLQKWLFERHTQQLVNGPRSNGQSPDMFVSRPSEDTERQPPFHLTGGAVDLTIADNRGQLLNMGTRFDKTTKASYTCHYESVGETNERARGVRDNRRFLYQSMIEAGFANIPSEWWHFSYGDQLWAALTGREKAIYGSTQPPFSWSDPEHR